MEHRAYLMRLKKNKIKDYVEIHKKGKIWKSVIAGLTKAGYKKMILFQLDNNVILFEEADNLESVYRYLNTDDASNKWDQMISEWMEIYPEFNEIKQDIEFVKVPVVFYYENGKLLH